MKVRMKRKCIEFEKLVKNMMAKKILRLDKIQKFTNMKI